ncbi:metallophosphoesterase [Massilia pseudoviolaceinigra]|uniref:metallophosphoesterase n=1 Tax=Massilia pseudoviolaceinigra TaxID=3057165 RepID=UPI0027967548|nr:metallophosphoesterase [Massilia sp. CCM 9206]MDQ1920143.1 metallophosphoesterase [Massilia sp. CCM 9206]
MSDFPQKRHRPIRNIVERIFSVMLLGGKVAAWSYRCGLHGKLTVVRYEMNVNREKPLPAPLRVGFVSDLHAGPTTHAGLFDLLRDQLLLLRPDVLLLGGDYVSFDARYVDRLRDVLTAYTPALGTYAVIGNHDIRNGRESIETALRNMGAQVLVNRNMALPAPFDMVSVCGIDDPWTGNADAARTFSESRQVKLFLTHSPDGLMHLDKEVFDVAFAGHTHGGQVARRNGAPVLQPTGPLSRQYCYGEFAVPGNGTMIVSRGFGCTLIPLRINADPELAICTLR